MRLRLEGERLRRVGGHPGAVGECLPAEGDRLDAIEAARALEELPVEQREVIIARLWGELSFEEIANIYGTAVSTAHRRYQQGIAALREKLEGICPNKRK